MSEENKQIMEEFKKQCKVLNEIRDNNKKLYDKFEKRENNLVHAIESTRNIFAHKTCKNNEPMIVTKEFLEELKDLINRMQETGYNKSVKKESIFFAQLDSSLLKTIEKMKENNYSYVPVLSEDEKIVGVLTENSILSFIVDHNQGYLFEDDEKLDLLKDYIPIDKQRNESFTFVSRKELLCNIQDMFLTAFENNKRLAAVFITEHGKQEEKLLGMVTAWDILGKQ